jgi:hypothetical protein
LCIGGPDFKSDHIVVDCATIRLEADYKICALSEFLQAGQWQVPNVSLKRRESRFSCSIFLSAYPEHGTSVYSGIPGGFLTDSSSRSHVRSQPRPMYQTFWTIGNGIFGSLRQISCSQKRFESVIQVSTTGCVAFPVPC